MGAEVRCLEAAAGGAVDAWGSRVLDARIFQENSQQHILHFVAVFRGWGEIPWSILLGLNHMTTCGTAN